MGDAELILISRIMSALGQKRTCRTTQNAMSALTPKKRDICSAPRRCPLCANSGHDAE